MPTNGMTIDSLNTVSSLTAQDKVPVWDNESSGEPTRKITAQNMANSVKSLGNLIGTGDLDSTPTSGSNKAVTSGGVYTAIQQSTADTGWIALNNTYPTRYRVRAGVCYINMRLTGGATPTDGTLLGTLPAAYRPAFEFAISTQNLRGSVSIRIDGTVYINANTTISGGLNNYMAAVLIYPIG